MGVRLSVYGMSDDQLASFRSAWNQFSGITDDRGYKHFAGLHGLPFPIHCRHSPRDGMDLLFLPWHRAYLYFFELALQDVDPNVSVPWWDWSSATAHNEGLPRSYGVRTLPNNEQNPLQSTLVDWDTSLRHQVRAALPGVITAAGRTLRDPEPPDELPREATIDSILSAPNFDDFSSRLENVHGALHVWVGGAMSAVPAAAYDPIFWAHHSMVDRLWYLWQLSEVGQDPPNEMLDLVLDPFPLTVRDTLSIQNLGYEYAVEMVE